MPEGITARVDPDTGERTEQRFSYQPYQPPEQTLDWNAVQENIKNHGVDAALKQAAAAQTFLAQRGYQKALEAAALEPDANKRTAMQTSAAAKWFPVMFGAHPQAVGPSVKALTPPPTATWKPGSNGAPGAFTMPGHMPIIPKAALPTYAWTPGTNGAPGAFTAPNARPIVPPGTLPVIRDVKGGLYRVAPGSGDPETLIQPPAQKEATPYTVTTGDDTSGKITQRLTAREFAERQRTIAREKIQPLLDEYSANEAEMKAGDFRTGFANILSRKSSNEVLAGKIKAAGFDVPSSTSASTTDLIELAPTAPENRVEGKRYKSATGKIGTWTKEGWKIE